MRVGARYPFSFIFCSLFFSTYSNAQPLAVEDHAKQQAPQSGSSNEGVSGMSTDAFFSLFEDPKIKSARAACMGGESYTQKFNGKTRQVSRMSNGYFYGMMMSFAKNACDAKETLLKSTLRKNPDGADARDVLNHYGQTVSSLSPDPLVQNYSLLLPLGMIESSGQYNDGRDQSSSNTGHDTTEAGLFQVSYNSTGLGGGKMKSVYEELLRDYGISSNANLKNNSKCLTGVFGINQALSKNDASYGSGPGVLFQDVMKGCPALAADYMAALLRHNKGKDTFHNGPLGRKEVQPRDACVQVLNVFKEHLAQGANCDSITALASQFPSDSRAKSVFAVNPPINRVGEIDRDSNGVASSGRTYDSAATNRSQADELEKAVASRTDPEAQEIKSEIARMRAEAEAVEKDPALIKAKAQELEEKIIPKIENDIKEARESAAKAKGEAAELRRQAALEKDADKKAELEKQATDKDEEAKQFESTATNLEKDLKDAKSLVEELKKKEEELKKQREKQIESIKLRIKTLESEIAKLKDPNNDQAKGAESEVKKKQDEVDKLKKELGELEAIK